MGKFKDIIIAHSSKDILPPPPPGISASIWLQRQEALRGKGGVPKEFLQRITTLRQMNLWVWLVLVMQHPWQFVADNEQQLLQKKINKKDIKYKGKTAI